MTWILIILNSAIYSSAQLRVFLVKLIQLPANAATKFFWYIFDKTIEPPFISFECLIGCYKCSNKRTISIPNILHIVNILNCCLHSSVASLYSLDSSINVDISDLELQLEFALFFLSNLCEFFRFCVDRNRHQPSNVAALKRCANKFTSVDENFFSTFAALVVLKEKFYKFNWTPHSSSSSLGFN